MSARSLVTDRTEENTMDVALAYPTNGAERPRARRSLGYPGRSPARRLAVAPLERPLLRLVALRAHPSGVGGGLTARDMVTDAEPW